MGHGAWGVGHGAWVRSGRPKGLGLGAWGDLRAWGLGPGTWVGSKIVEEGHPKPFFVLTPAQAHAPSPSSFSLPTHAPGPKPHARSMKKQSLPLRSSSAAEVRILEAVKRIPRGRVCTYGGVAQLARLPRRARLVGAVLRTTSVKNVPWFRVINSSGRISFPEGSDAYLLQRRKLEAEGIVFVGGRVDLRKYGWPEEARSLDEYLWAPR